MIRVIFRRLSRGDYPEQRETWQQYQQRSSNASIIAFAAILTVTCLFLLAEIIERASQ